MVDFLKPGSKAHSLRTPRMIHGMLHATESVPWVIDAKSNTFGAVHSRRRFGREFLEKRSGLQLICPSASSTKNENSRLQRIRSQRRW